VPDDAPSVIAELTALESLALYSVDGKYDGPTGRLDDDALSAIADLPACKTCRCSAGPTPSTACSSCPACRSCGTSA
jgi:hypothetical protein